MFLHEQFDFLIYFYGVMMNFRIGALSLLVFVLLLAGCKKEEMDRYGDLAGLIRDTGMSPRFTGYQPRFHVQQDTFSFIKADGLY